MPKYVFNHIAIYDPTNDTWSIHHKLDKRIPKTHECYGSNSIATGPTLESAIDSAVRNGVKRWDIQIKNLENSKPISLKI